MAAASTGRLTELKQHEAELGADKAGASRSCSVRTVMGLGHGLGLVERLASDSFGARVERGEVSRSGNARDGEKAKWPKGSRASFALAGAVSLRSGDTACTAVCLSAAHATRAVCSSVCSTAWLVAQHPGSWFKRQSSSMRAKKVIGSCGLH